MKPIILISALLDGVDELEHILVEPVGGGLDPLAFEAYHREALALEEVEGAGIVRQDIAVELVEAQDMEGVADEC